MKSSITCSICFSFIWPWPMAMRALGTIFWTSAAMASIVSTRLWMKNTWPLRASSSSIADRITPSPNWTTCVLMASRSRGGVSMTDISRMPSSDIFKVLGMGVAESVKTSTFFFNCLSFSLCATPNRCSSSTTTRPSFGNTTSLDKMR